MTSLVSSPKPKPHPTTGAELLAAHWPPLAKYWPNLWSVSAPQAAFLCLDQEEAGYGGAAGGGKSDALLSAALQYVDIPDYAALILRRTYSELMKSDGLIPRAEKWLAGTDAKRHDEGKLWTFPSGARLEFGHCKDEKDKHNYQSAAYQFIAFDELTSFTETIYEYIGFSRSRRLLNGPIARVPIRVRWGSNPGNVGHLWVRRRGVDAKTRKPGTIFIPAKVQDNPGLDVEQYRKTMGNLSGALQAQLLDGNWDAFEGASFPDFDPDVHCVPAFPVPDSWERFESLDHGLSNPTCVLAWAVDYDGNMVTFDSYYSERDRLISDHAAELKKRREWWWPPGTHPVCHADHDLWEKTGGLDGWETAATHVTQYQAAEVGGFVQAVKNRGVGRGRMLELLKPDPSRAFPGWHPRHGELGSPRWFIVGDRCPDLVEQIKGAPTNADPVTRYGPGEITDPAWERDYGHATAAARYGAVTWKQPSVEPKPVHPDPRAGRLHDLIEKQHEPGRRFRHT